MMPIKEVQYQMPRYEKVYINFRAVCEPTTQDISVATNILRSSFIQENCIAFE